MFWQAVPLGMRVVGKKKKSKLDKSVMIKNYFWQVYFIKRPLFGAACEWTTMQHVEAPLMIKVMVMFFIEWYNNENEQLLIYTHWYKLTIEIKIKKRQTMFFFICFQVVNVVIFPKQLLSAHTSWHS